jgi:hypothetical protein
MFLELSYLVLELLLVSSLSHAASDGALSVLHSLACLLIFHGIIFVVEEAVPIHNDLLKVFSLFVG